MSVWTQARVIVLSLLKGVLVYCLIALALTQLSHLLVPRYAKIPLVKWTYGLLVAANIGLMVTVTFRSYAAGMRKARREGNSHE